MTAAFKPLRAARTCELVDVAEPELFREQFPYTEVPRILFDGTVVPVNPARDIWITDTTFRDGQQARPPYSPEQIEALYRFLHRLGGPNGVVRQCEFFVYSKRDREAIERCLALECPYPEVTGWIRAKAEDFKLVKELGLKETGILTSVSDYHIFMKLQTTRAKSLERYLAVVKAALSEGIIPRCHFEDITRADIYGFCIPFAIKLRELSEESGIPIKIRLCDTLGYGISYPGAALPRSVPKLATAFCRDAGYPSERLEWHGHNDFHKVHVNGATAWLYGVAALNASLLGFGERCGNPPLEGAVMEYIGLRGGTNGIDTHVITEIADYFRSEIRADVSSNYPFVGKDFNTTRAGIHADGLLKNPEIYNVFDTDKILKRQVVVMVTDKSGVAGIAQWLNDYTRATTGPEAQPVSKRHPGIRKIHKWVMEQYAQGRTTSISAAEMVAQAKRHLPSLFESDFQRVKAATEQRAKALSERISSAPEIQSMDPEQMEPFLKRVIRDEPFIQLLAVTNPAGFRLTQVHAQWGEKGLFRSLLRENFSEHDWFQNVLETGEPYYSDLFVSRFTGALIITAAHPIFDGRGQITAIIDVDFKFDELVKLVNDLPQDLLESDTAQPEADA